MSRWKAAGIHFALSLAIATVLVCAMLTLWYPPPYFGLMGGLTLVLLIAGCDVVLGPLMTSIVFKSGKRGLVFDLSVIAFLQAVALVYGLYTMFEARPVYAVFAVDRFEVASANELQAADLARARPEFASLPLTGPRIVAAEIPKDRRQHEDLMFRSLFGGRDLKASPNYYVPYEAAARTVASKAKPLASLERVHPGARNEIARKLGDTPSRPLDELGYLPVVGRFRSMTALVDRRSGALETIVDIDPW